MGWEILGIVILWIAWQFIDYFISKMERRDYPGVEALLSMLLAIIGILVVILIHGHHVHISFT